VCNEPKDFFAELICGRQVRAELRISVRTLRRLVSAGELVPMLLRGAHGAHRFRPDDVAVVRQRRSEGRSWQDVVAGAMQYLAEQHAETPAAICPRCCKTTVNRDGDFCSPCAEAHELWKTTFGS